MNVIKQAIKQLFCTFTPVDYFRQSIILTKGAIDVGDGDKIIKLCPVIVSSSMMVGRTISGMYKSIEILFQNKDYAFEDNWRRWSACMLNVRSLYKGFSNYSGHPYPKIKSGLPEIEFLIAS